MKHAYQVATVTATAALSAALLLAPVPAVGQVPAPANAGDQASAARARRIAQRFEARARVLTIFDRQGNVVTTVGERAIYEDPAFSPDRTRLAVTKWDLESETEDLWVLDIATGNSTRITSVQTLEEARTPVWSPDGSRLAYVALRGGYEGLYRRASNGQGTEELLYRHPGANMRLTDWSLDGRFLSFSTTDLSGGRLYVLPLAGDGERKPTEVFRSESQLRGSSFSPDSRFLSYTSDQSDTNHVYVRQFDPSAGAGAPPAAGPWQVSDQGGLGTAALYAGWRRDGKELFYVAADRGVMAVEVRTALTFDFGKPTLLFRLSEAVPVNPVLVTVSRDGERVAIAVPHAPTLQQITVVDRQGQVRSRVGEPGRYVQPALSPDGTRVAVMRTDPREGDVDIWTVEVATGKGTPVTNDTVPEDAPIWSPDGRYVAYGSRRGSFSSIYRKAWDGTGTEEKLFQYTPGAFLVVTDWSADGRFLTFNDECAGVLHVVPVGGDQPALERKAIDWLRDEYSVAQARFSPDSRFIAYLSDEIEADVFEVYVRPFDAGTSDVSAGGAKPARVSKAGALGMIFWRQDGKELYYLTPDWEVMAVDVATTPTFQAGTPKVLFKLPGPLPGNPQHWRNVSPDGQRFVFTINVPVSIR
jgi:Tol biopolymer transport system component